MCVVPVGRRDCDFQKPQTNRKRFTQQYNVLISFCTIDNDLIDQ